MASHHSGLGERARELLVAAHAHNGKIFRFEFEEGGPLVRAGSFERTGAEWNLALEELVDKGLAIYREGSPTEHGETYELTPGAR
ncbi:MAG TPA: hypothetical protein VFW01_08005 [bacterium]|nr:hypothetical protein [bacterium]